MMEWRGEPTNARASRWSHQWTFPRGLRGRGQARRRPCWLSRCWTEDPNLEFLSSSNRRANLGLQWEVGWRLLEAQEALQKAASNFGDKDHFTVSRRHWRFTWLAQILFRRVTKLQQDAAIFPPSFSAWSQLTDQLGRGEDVSCDPSSSSYDRKHLY